MKKTIKIEKKKEVDCVPCSKTGLLPDKTLCPACKGTGVVEE